VKFQRAIERARQRIMGQIGATGGDNLEIPPFLVLTFALGDDSSDLERPRYGGGWLVPAGGGLAASAVFYTAANDCWVTAYFSRGGAPGNALLAMGSESFMPVAGFGAARIAQVYPLNQLPPETIEIGDAASFAGLDVGVPMEAPADTITYAPEILVTAGSRLVLQNEAVNQTMRLGFFWRRLET